MGDEEFRPRLFVGGLSGPVEKEDLKQVFSEYGEVIDVWVAYDPPGFAFVEYSSMDSAKAAKDALHMTDMFDSKIKVELTKHKKGDRQSQAIKNLDLGDKPRLFVGGMADGVEASQLKQVFEKIGPVTDVFVSKGKGYAFVEYGSMAHAKRAITQLNQTEQFGQVIRIEMSSAKGGSGRGERRGRGRGGDRSAPYPSRGRPAVARRPYYEDDHYYHPRAPHPASRADPYYDDYYAHPPPRPRRHADPYADPYAAPHRRYPPPPPPRDPYYNDVYASAAYSAAAPARPAADPYAADRYAKPAAEAEPRYDPYAARSETRAPDPRVAPRAADPYAAAADPYNREAYKRGADPYTATTDPYGRAVAPAAPEVASEYGKVGSGDPYARSGAVADPYVRSAADPYYAPV